MPFSCIYNIYNSPYMKATLDAAKNRQLNLENPTHRKLIAKQEKQGLCYRRPGHGDEDPGLHGLDQRHRLVHCIAPALNRPALLSAGPSLLQVGKLPEMVDRVKLSNLDEPGSNAFHDLPSGLEASSPVSLPLQQIAGVESIRSKLKNTSQLARGSGWPEGKLLHQRNLLGGDQLAELLVEIGKVGVVGDGVSGFVVTLVPLVLPNVHYEGGTIS